MNKSPDKWVIIQGSVFKLITFPNKFEQKDFPVILKTTKGGSHLTSWSNWKKSGIKLKFNDLFSTTQSLLK